MITRVDRRVKPDRRSATPKLLRALVVEDELRSRARIKELFALEPDIELIGESHNGSDALALLEEHQPELVVMGAQISGLSGFDVLRALPSNQRPAIIIVSAHERDAVAAFEVEAVDYLLKPFSPSRFVEALQRARHYLQAPLPARSGSNSAGDETLPQLKRIAVKTGERTVFLPVEQLDYIESAANYALLHVGTETHVLRQTLTSLMAKLPGDRFVRVSRSAIVHIRMISEVRQDAQGGRLLMLSNGKSIPTTRGAREIRGWVEGLGLRRSG